MEGGNRKLWPPWKNLKQHLRWNRINILGCCGSSKWVLDTTAGEEPLMVTGYQSPAASETRNTISCIGQNLATALAADRRRMNVGPTDGVVVKPLKSIVRLFEIEEREVIAAEDGGGVIGIRCCLCTDRYKGAALIPCGHTYCRVCSRAMWSKTESCLLCKRSILEVLDLF